MTGNTLNDIPNVDILAIGAHPDDVEVGVGGMLHKFAKCGLKTGILDFTRGEMSTRGTVEERAAEAAEAASILGATHRANAGLPDGGLADSTDQRHTLVPYLRAFAPRIIIAPFEADRHPDHEAAHHLTRNANYLSGLARIDTGQPPHRAPHVYYYRVYGDSTPPQVIVNMSEEFEVKMNALQAHRSQFHNPEYAGAPTYVSSEGFWNSIRTRAEYWGQRIGASHAETLYCLEPLALDALPGMTST